MRFILIVWDASTCVISQCWDCSGRQQWLFWLTKADAEGYASCNRTLEKRVDPFWFSQHHTQKDKTQLPQFQSHQAAAAAVPAVATAKARQLQKRMKMNWKEVNEKVSWSRPRTGGTERPPSGEVAVTETSLRRSARPRCRRGSMGASAPQPQPWEEQEKRSVHKDNVFL